jgi:DNA-binding MarR family transcriptional regulator
MSQDSVDLLLNQWHEERPGHDLSGLSIVVRMQALSQEFRREAESALTSLNLQLWEYDALSALRRQGGGCELAATELARETRLSAGAMTNRIDRLKEKGYVQRRPDPDDRRGVLVSLTAAGRQVIDDAIQARFDVANHQVGSLSSRDREMLAKLLRKLVN